MLQPIAMTLNPQFITDDSGKRKAVILSMKEYEQMLSELELAEDTRLYEQAMARNEKTITLQEYKKKRGFL
jgi:PHD/YefM family antitoxin component YafN of YafNO toxin-antitoxin module